MSLISGHANENWSMPLKCVVGVKESFVKFKILYPFSVPDGLCKLINGYCMWTSAWRIKCSSCIFTWLQILSSCFFTKTETVCEMYPGRFLWSLMKIHENCLLFFQGQNQFLRAFGYHKSGKRIQLWTFLWEPTTQPLAVTFTIQCMRIIYCKLWYSFLFKNNYFERSWILGKKKKIRIEIHSVRLMNHHLQGQNINVTHLWAFIFFIWNV